MSLAFTNKTYYQTFFVISNTFKRLINPPCKAVRNIILTRKKEMASYPNIHNFRSVEPNFSFGINWSEFGKVKEDYETLLFDVNWDENINIDMDSIETCTSEETLLFDVNLFVYLPFFYCCL